MCNSFSVTWDILVAIYKVLLIFCIFWQAGRVSQMKFKHLALEGDVSLQAVLLVIIVSFFGAMVEQIFERGSDDYLTSFIIETIWYMLFAITIIATTFLPKVSYNH